ncbi:hypothetical protein LINPERHAP2_LOCUS5492 [Linum perenne]
MSAIIRFDPSASNVLARHVFASNLLFRDISCRGKYQFLVTHKELIPSFAVPIDDLHKYQVNLNSYLGGIGWLTWFRSLSSLPTVIYPDAIFQFYANLKVECGLPTGSFSTFVDGYLIFITPELLNEVLDVPIQGPALGSEEDFPNFNFEPISAVQMLTNNPTGDRFPEGRPPNTFQLPAHLRVLHFLITRVFFPRTTNREVITALDTWILHHAEDRVPVSCAHLMFTHMVRAATDFSRGNLPYASLVTTLLLRLGLSFRHRYIEERASVQLRAQHVLRHILWTPASWAFTSGIDTDEDSDSDGENIPPNIGISGTPWCPYPTASEYASDPDLDF